MYKALYRKWRPKVFEDVVSQPHVTRTLQNELKTGRVGHAYLFTGSRGTGKTTCAKIFAMAVNCEHPKEDGSPCLECAVCTGIDQGSLLDVSEIDAASNNGVEDIRKLREEANFTPAVCKYRVYIIDEVHMLSGSAFNALLKIMEEPPAHVIFILATTEVHKVPATILSRCQRFDFHRVKAEDIANRILYIADHEEFTVTREAAELIAKLADGGMRDALSLLDQCVAYQSDIDVDTVSLAAGLADRSYLYQFVEAISSKNASAALEMVDTLYQQSRDLMRLCEELAAYYRNLMVVKTVRNSDGLVLCTPSELEQLKTQAEKIPLAEILYNLSELQGCLDRISGATGKRTEFEMSLIRLCSPQLSGGNDAILARLDRLETQLRSGMIQSAEVPVISQGKEQIEEKKNVTLSQAERELSSVGEERTEQSAIKPQIIPEQEDTVIPVDCWPEIMERLAKTDLPLCGLLSSASACIIGNALCITSNSSMVAAMLKRDGAAGRLSEAVLEQLGKRYRIRVRSVSQTPDEEVKKQDELSKLLETAEQSGVSVHLK